MGEQHFGGVFTFSCLDAAGRVVWCERSANMVMAAGLYHFLDTELCGVPQATTWYLGLLAASPTIAREDTMVSHDGWTELTSYSEASRPVLAAIRVGGVVTNAAAKAVFTFPDGATPGGGFLCSDSAKGGVNGVLFSAVEGSGRTVPPGQTLSIEYRFSMNDDEA
jgi:hypothetical protein